MLARPNQDGTFFTVAVVARIGLESGIEVGIEAAVQSVPPGTDLVVLPYLGTSPWFMDKADRKGYAHAERSPFSTLQAAIGAAKHRNIPVVVSYYEAAAEGTFYATAAVVAGDGSVIGTYRQAHALNRPGWHEQLYVQPGTAGGFPVFQAGAARIGLLLGSDLWVPEVARLLDVNGAEIIIVQSGIFGYHEVQADTLGTARAIENGCFCLLAKRGKETLVFDPLGRPVTMHAEGDDQRSFRIDLAEQRELRRRGDPVNMRRPAIYGGLVRGREETHL